MNTPPTDKYGPLTFDRCPHSNYTYSQRMAWSVGWNEALAALSADSPQEGHGEPCYWCKEPCDGLAADPGRWPIALCHRDDPGVVKWHHERCVSERLIENQPAPSSALTPEAALTHARALTTGIYGRLRELLDSYTKPCLDPCHHVHCPLLRDLHQIMADSRTEAVNAANSATQEQLAQSLAHHDAIIERCAQIIEARAWLGQGNAAGAIRALKSAKAEGAAK